MMKSLLRSLLCILGIAAARGKVSFQDTCLNEVLLFRDGSLRAQEYPGLLATLTHGRIEETIPFKRLPRRMILVFNLLSSAGGARQASIPTRTAEDWLSVCHMLEESMQQLGLISPATNPKALDAVHKESELCLNETLRGLACGETTSLDKSQSSNHQCVMDTNCKAPEMPHYSSFATDD